MSPAIMFLLPVLAGLLSHQVFRYREPTLGNCLGGFLLAETALAVMLFGCAHPIHALCTTSAMYIASLSLSILIYRAILHPLAIPGPFLARLSKLWAVAVTVEGRNHATIAELHATYGDFVRIGPNEVSISNVAAIHEIYGPRSEWTRSDWYKGVPRPANSESLMSLRGHAEHSQRHKVWDRAFTTTAVKDYQPLVTQRVQQLSDRLASESGLGAVDIGKWFSACTFDIMGDLAFDGGFELVQNGDIGGYWQTINEAVRIGAIFINLPWLAEPLAWLAAKMPFLPLACKKAKLERFAERQVRSRQQKVAHSKDLSYWLIGEDTGICEISLPDLVAEAVLVIIAGSDSTTLASFFLFFLLGQHPAIVARLRQELQDTHDRYGQLTIDKLSELPYLNACINESLRLYPPIPNGHPRRAPKGGATVAGQFIPEGTTVIIPAYTLHRDPKYWSEPNTFRPERWLPEGTSAGEKDDFRAYIPFSYGPYSCIGRNLARHEVRLLVATIITRFDFQLADGFDPQTFEQQITGEFLLTRPVLPMVLRERMQE
ncbi:cytochrome P450 [Calocera cornea HHB12733]|uniref:Cytochrome P450 n=1 Tax=Calocera cornea HHB12733 TaxID=1353952 RepID=A0A165CDL6_9BASI|nr:cytochrome P450 [Calocera cornea HHB12733]